METRHSTNEDIIDSVNEPVLGSSPYRGSMAPMGRGGSMSDRWRGGGVSRGVSRGVQGKSGYHNAEVHIELSEKPPNVADALLPGPENAPSLLPEPENAPSLLPEPENAPSLLPETESCPSLLPGSDSVPTLLPVPESCPSLFPGSDSVPTLLPVSESCPSLLPGSENSPSVQLVQESTRSQCNEPPEHPKGSIRIHRPSRGMVCHKCGGRITKASRSLSLCVLPEEVPGKVEGDSSQPGTPLRVISPPHTPVNSSKPLGIDPPELICHCAKRKVSVSIKTCF